MYADHELVWPPSFDVGAYAVAAATYDGSGYRKRWIRKHWGTAASTTTARATQAAIIMHDSARGNKATMRDAA